VGSFVVIALFVFLRVIYLAEGKKPNSVATGALLRWLYSHFCKYSNGSRRFPD
jgi:hypothetical protein